MPPKVNAVVASPLIYVVIHNNGVDSVHASPTSAHERAAAMEAEDSMVGSIKVELHKLKDGTVQITAAAPKVDQLNSEESEAPKADIVVKKTKTPAEQRAINADKSADKAAGAELPANVKTLLAGTGDALSGLIIVVTGIPPTLGRKNAEKLVTNYGGKLTKSLSKNTSYVVVGNDAGPKKLEQIEGLGVKTLDEDGLIEMLERSGDSGSRGAKRGAEDGKAVNPKKQKK